MAADLAVHLDQAVFPEVPVRHWIGSFPRGLRALLGYDRNTQTSAGAWTFKCVFR